MTYFDEVSLIRIQSDEPTPQELLDSLPNATEIIAVELPGIEELMDIDESSIGQKECTQQTLLWNFAASVHNSECAIAKCIQDFSKDKDAEVVICASLCSIGTQIDYMADKANVLINGRFDDPNEALPLVVRVCTSLESLSGAWRGIREIFKYRKEGER